MIKKGVKLFEPGNYSQGNFPIDKVKEVFEGATNIGAQFAHTSKISKAGKVALELGEFSNFNINDEGIVTADVEFNEKGETMYEDGTINGCSIEISDGAISKVAILPVGVTPAICGAEFDESGSFTFGGEMEFAEEASAPTLGEMALALNGYDMTNDVENEFALLQEAVWNLSDEKYSIANLEKAGYTITKVGEFQEKTVVEIRKEFEVEFKAKEEGKSEFQKLKSEGKITKAMEDAGLNSEFMSMLYSKNTTGETIEFGEENFEFAKVILDVLKATPGKKLEAELTEVEFAKNTEVADKAETQRIIDLCNNQK
jgi:hypothetical protein